MRLESAFSWSIIRICISASAIDLYQGDYVQIVTENGHSGARHGKLSSHEHSSDTYGLHCVQILRGTCSLLSCIDHDVSFFANFAFIVHSQVVRMQALVLNSVIE